MQLDYIRFMLMGFKAACYVLDPTNMKKKRVEYLPPISKTFNFPTPYFATEGTSVDNTFTYFIHTNVVTEIATLQLSQTHVLSFCYVNYQHNQGMFQTHALYTYNLCFYVWCIYTPISVQYSVKPSIYPHKTVSLNMYNVI